MAGALYALLEEAVIVLLLLLLVYVLTIRRLESLVFEGAALRSGFGENDFHRKFVFVRYVGNPVAAVYPRVLFPDDALTRFDRAVRNHRVRDQYSFLTTK